MTRKTAFVKLSGDLVQREDILEWIRSLAEGHFVVICTGGGTQISDAFKARGFTVEFDDHGRVTRTFDERQLARDVLEQNRDDIQDLLAARGITVVVIIPVLDIGSVLCHVNGDLFALNAERSFDRVCVLTLKDRAEDKKAQFKAYEKIEIVSF